MSLFMAILGTTACILGALYDKEFVTVVGNIWAVGSILYGKKG